MLMNSFQESSFRSAEHFTQPSASFRSPRRITITVPYQLYQRLVEQSNREGRSLSNLAAFLLERCCGSSLDG